MRRILASPLPSTVSSSRGRMRGERSTEMTERSRRVSDARARSRTTRRMGLSILASTMSARLRHRRRAGGGARGCAGACIRTPVLVSEAAGRGERLHRLPQVREPAARAAPSRSAARSTSCSTLSDDERRRGVVAFSSGNHAQGVALAARIVGTTRRHLHADRRAAPQARRDARLRRRGRALRPAEGRPRGDRAQDRRRERARARAAVRRLRDHGGAGHGGARAARGRAGPRRAADARGRRRAHGRAAARWRARCRPRMPVIGVEADTRERHATCRCGRASA